MERWNRHNVALPVHDLEHSVVLNNDDEDDEVERGAMFNLRLL